MRKGGGEEGKGGGEEGREGEVLLCKTVYSQDLTRTG